jgi:hypothetical protein
MNPLRDIRFARPAVALPLLFCCLSGIGAQDLRNPEFMAQARKGFDQIYNLDYDQAQETFSKLQARYPEHPAPPLYLATIIWLRELVERNELDLDHFIAPSYFTKPSESEMRPEDKRRFFDYLDTSQKLCESVLKKDPQNLDARYFLGSVYGLRAGFAITIGRSYSDAFSWGKKAYKVHHELVKEKPDYYDAYMTVGLYEYVVANLPWYIKWIAMIVGYRGSQERGFEYLELTAQKGLYAADDARVLLTVLYVRERRYADALRIIQILHQKYPRNYLLHLNLAQILEMMGRRQQAVAEYRAIVQKAEAGVPNYQRIPLNSLRTSLARRFLSMKEYSPALEQSQALLSQAGISVREKLLAHLRAGEALDALGKRAEAVKHYEAVLKLPDSDEAHSKARRYLSRPYTGGD